MAPKGNRRFQILKHHTLGSILNFGSVLVAHCHKVSIAQKPGRIFSLLADFLPSASWLKPTCFPILVLACIGYPQEVKHNSSIPTHKQKHADFIMANQVWWYFFEIFVAWRDFLKSFPEASHFYFNYMILGWTVQYSGWVEKVKRRLSNKIWALRQVSRGFGPED